MKTCHTIAEVSKVEYSHGSSRRLRKAWGDHSNEENSLVYSKDLGDKLLPGWNLATNEKAAGLDMYDPQSEGRTDGVRIVSITSEIAGRALRSPSQHRCINDHSFSVKLGCFGRSGRSPCIIATVAA